LAPFLAKRTIHSAISLCGLIILVFVFARLTGNPADLYLPVDVSPDLRQHFIEVHGFDDPIVVQFGRFLAGLLHLDFGQSLQVGRPALTTVIEAFPITLTLAAVSIALALFLAITIGAIAALRPNGIFDRLANVISLITASLPSFWAALVVILIFAVGLGLVPTSGMGSFQQWLLPVFVLFLRPAGVLIQVVRGAVLTALSAAYVKTARAKGAGTQRIVFVHCLRNAMLPVITVAGDQAASMINGAIVVEIIFAFPGIGKLMVDSINTRDFAVIQAAIMFTAGTIFLLNILVDVAYALLDPRIRQN
jgi:peptide/nickel transport system permease protein